MVDIMSLEGASRHAALSFNQDLENVINNNQDKKGDYYILVFSKVREGVVNTKFVVMDDLPQKMLGTMVYSINNKAGSCDRLWCLPLDRPTDLRLFGEKEGESEEILESAEDMPVVYSKKEK